MHRPAAALLEPMQPSPYAVHEATRKRRRWGCACSCLTVSGILVFTIVITSVILLRSIPVSTADRWIGPDTDLFGFLKLDPSDSGVSDTLRPMLEEIQREQERSGQPSDMADIQKALGAAQSALQFLMHNRIYFYGEPSGGRDGQEMAGVVQFSRMLGWSLVRSILTADRSRVTKADGVEIIDFGNRRGTLTRGGLQRGLLYFGSSDEVITAMASRPAKRTEALTETQQEFYAELETPEGRSGEDLAIVVINSPRRFERFFQTLDKESPEAGTLAREALRARNVAAADIRGLRLSGDLKTSRTASIHITLFCVNPDAARRVADFLRDAGTAVTPPGSSTPAIRTEGSDVTLAIEQYAIQKLMN